MAKSWEEIVSERMERLKSKSSCEKIKVLAEILEDEAKELRTQIPLKRLDVITNRAERELSIRIKRIKTWLDALEPLSTSS